MQFSDVLFRTHRTRHGPLHYSFSRLNRFDAPNREYGVMYAGRDPYGSFMETLARTAGQRTVTTTALQERALSELKPVRPLRLIDLTASGVLVRLGTDSRLFSGDDYEITQAWSKALHSHPVQADGLIYPSRLDPVRHNMALFSDRDALFVELHREGWYATGKRRHLLAEIVNHYRIELVESQLVAPRKRPAPLQQPGLFPDRD